MSGGGTGGYISLLPSFWGNFFLLPKLGLKIGGGQCMIPALSCKGSIVTNLRLGPTLAVLIHFLLPAPAKIGPGTNSLMFVLTAARFWQQC